MPKYYSSRHHHNSKRKCREVSEPTTYSAPPTQETICYPVPSAAAEGAGEWSPWYYGVQTYRYRKIPYELISTIGQDSRNTIVAEGQGQYVHYEFSGKENWSNYHNMSLGAVQPTQILQTGMAPSAPIQESAPVYSPQPLPQNYQYGYDGVNEASELRDDNPRRRIIDIAIDGTTMTIPIQISDSLLLDKEVRRRLKEERHRHMSSSDKRRKVKGWLNV